MRWATTIWRVVSFWKFDVCMCFSSSFFVRSACFVGLSNCVFVFFCVCVYVCCAYVCLLNYVLRWAVWVFVLGKLCVCACVCVFSYLWIRLCVFIFLFVWFCFCVGVIFLWSWVCVFVCAFFLGFECLSVLAIFRSCVCVYFVSLCFRRSMAALLPWETVICINVLYMCVCLWVCEVYEYS